MPPGTPPVGSHRDADVLELQELVDADGPALASEPGGLHASERRRRVGDDPWLSPTMPASSASATRSARSRSFV